MLADVEAGEIDVVVVYKIDRLSRSMLDFLKLVETFERHGVTFVSITQAFNTTSSMDAWNLNMLLSFAQFEREVIASVSANKVAASRKKGMWMGGWMPLGYEVRDRKLVIHQEDAERVQSIFQRFVQLKLPLCWPETGRGRSRLTATVNCSTRCHLRQLNNRVYVVRKRCT